MGRNDKFERNENAMKIAIIGHFGGNESFVDGQTVKTKALYDELGKATDWEIETLDTYYKDKSPVRLMIKLIALLFTTRHIIILLSGNGMKFFFPVLYLYSRILGGNVYHDVIGGNLSEYVKKNPAFRKYLNAFRVNWVETALLKKELEEIGVKNAGILVNFRRKEMVSADELEREYTEPYRFCTFSRVAEAKGVGEAITAIRNVNKAAGKCLCTLDIYGPVDDEYKAAFESLLGTAPNEVRYRGTVPTECAVNTLKEYYATLFPTRWEGESNAGTVTESQFAGVPVIATDWRCNSEMIESGVDGVVYPGKEAHTLEEGIEWLIAQKERITQIKRNSLKKAEQYLPEYSVPKIIECIQSHR